MSKIGNAVLGAQERTGKEIGELTPEDIFDQEIEDLHTGFILQDMRTGVAHLNTLRGDLSPIKEDLDLLIAQLIKIAERI